MVMQTRLDTRSDFINLFIEMAKNIPQFDIQKKFVKNPYKLNLS